MMSSSFFFIVSAQSVISFHHSSNPSSSFFNFTSDIAENQQNELTTFIQSFKLDEVENIYVFFANEHNMFIPSAVFDVKELKTYYNTCFNQDDKNEVDFNRLYQSSIVNVFSYPIWFKRFWIKKIPNVQFKHYLSAQLKAIGGTSTSYKHIHLSIFDSFFSLLIFNQNEFVFHNNFLYQNAEDIIYYINFSLKQLNELENEKIKFNLYSFHPKKENLINELQEKCHNFSLLPSINWLENRVEPFKFLQNCV